MRRMHRRRGERGAAAVEAALLTPLIALLVFGMIEMAFLVRDYVGITSATRVGARIASAAPGAGEAVNCRSREASQTDTVCVAGRVPRLVQMAATAMQTNGDAVPMDQVDAVLVYDASTADRAPGPATARACTAAIECVWFKWDVASSEFKFMGGGWNEKDINSCPTSADKVGVKLIARHPSLTGFFGTIPLEDHAVMTFEPETLDKCKPTK